MKKTQTSPYANNFLGSMTPNQQIKLDGQATHFKMGSLPSELGNKSKL